MKEFLTIDEVAEYLAIKRSSLYSMVEEKEIPHYRIGRLIRFRKADIDAWLETVKSEPVNLERETRRILSSVAARKPLDDRNCRVYNSKLGRPDRVKDLGKEA